MDDGAENKSFSILVVGSKWPPETFLARLFRGLLKNGVTLTVASATKPEAEWFSYPNFKWLYTPSWKAPFLWRLGRLGKMWLRSLVQGRHDLSVFRTHISRNQPLSKQWYQWHQFLPYAGKQWDVIYFPWNMAAIKHLPLFDLGIPTIISCRGSQVNVAPHSSKRGELVDGLIKTFAKATAVHCVSEDIKQEGMQYGLNPALAHVIRPAVDQDFFYPATAKQPAKAFRIVTTGSLIWRKGQEFALTAVRYLLDKGIQASYDIIGDGPEWQRLLYTISDLDLEAHVCWHEKLKPKEVRNILQQADVFLLSSHSEGISNAVLEAMACGLPIVTTDCGGMPEAVTNGVEGFVVPTQNPIMMAEKLHHLANDPNLRQQMGQQGRARIVKEFALDHQIILFEKLFQETVFK